MGTKRVGLARTQALLENLKRSLDWNGATLTDVIINTAQNVTVSGITTLAGNNSITGDVSATGEFSATRLANKTGLVAPTIAAKLQIANAASTALGANTWNLAPADGNAVTLTLPEVGSSSKAMSSSLNTKLR